MTNIRVCCSLACFLAKEGALEGGGGGNGSRDESLAGLGRARNVFFDVLKNEEIKNFGVGSTTTPIEKKECKSANRVQIDCQSQ